MTEHTHTHAHRNAVFDQRDTDGSYASPETLFSTRRLFRARSIPRDPSSVPNFVPRLEATETKTARCLPVLTPGLASYIIKGVARTCAGANPLSNWTKARTQRRVRHQRAFRLGLFVIHVREVRHRHTRTEVVSTNTRRVSP